MILDPMSRMALDIQSNMEAYTDCLFAEGTDTVAQCGHLFKSDAELQLVIEVYKKHLATVSTREQAGWCAYNVLTIFIIGRSTVDTIPITQRLFKLIAQATEDKFGEPLNLEEPPQPPEVPAHYASAVDPIAYAKENLPRDQVEGFLRINAIKYLTRYDKKGTPKEDLAKAKHYIEMLAAYLE